jgi:hypothetical protein
MFGLAMAYGLIKLLGILVVSSDSSGDSSGMAFLAETATALLCALVAVSSLLMWRRLKAGWWITLASASLFAVWHGVRVARTTLFLRQLPERDARYYWVQEEMLSECLYYLMPPVALVLFLLWVRSEFNSRPEPKLENEKLF